jgi:F-type H+-transporting ATPase subunit c
LSVADPSRKDKNFVPSFEEMRPVSKFKKILMFVFGLLLVSATPVFAQGGGVGSSVDFSRYFGVGLTVIGAAYGIGRLAASAYEGMSRQPEVAGNIQTAMIIAAALIEGFTFYALYICMAY